MHTINKNIVTDENKRPIAVQIAYEDWLEIERRLGLLPASEGKRNLSEHIGVLAIREDPAAYQTRMRAEWK